MYWRHKDCIHLYFYYNKKNYPNNQWAIFAMGIFKNSRIPKLSIPSIKMLLSVSSSAPTPPSPSFLVLLPLWRGISFPSVEHPAGNIGDGSAGLLFIVKRLRGELFFVPSQHIKFKKYKDLKKETLSSIGVNKQCPYKKLMICVLPTYNSNESEEYQQQFLNVMKEIL